MADDERQDGKNPPTALGAYSSHPYWLRRRSQWVWWVAALPLILCLAGNFTFAIAANHWISWLQQIPVILQVVLTVGAFCMAFGMAATINSALALRAAESGREKRFDVDFFDSSNIVIVVLGCILACVVPAVAANATGLSISFRVLVCVFTSLPLLAVVVLTFPTRARPARRLTTGIGRLASGVELVMAVAGLAWVVTVVHDLALLTKNTFVSDLLAELIPGYQLGETVFRGALVLTPIIYLLLTLRRRLQIAVLSTETPLDPTGSEPVDPITAEDDGAGIITRLFNRLLRSRRKTSRPPQESLAKKRQRFREAMTAEFPVTSVQQYRFPAQASLRESDNTLLLAGHRPTREQNQAIRQFDSLFSSANDTRSTLTSDRNCDLVIHGPTHSGKTSALMACAVDAVVRRGQYVMLIASDAGEVEHLRTTALRHFSALDLESLVGIESVSEPLVEEWRSSPMPYLPQVLIATVGQWQHFLYDEALEICGAFLRLYQTVLVDGLERFDDIERSHLPFLLDKQRWLIEDQFSIFQAVVSTRRLSNTGIQLVGGRLATSSMRLAEQCVELRSLDMPAADVIVLPAMDDNRLRLLKLLGNDIDIDVLLVTGPDSLEKQAGKRYPVILFPGRLSQGSFAAIRSTVASEGAVVVCTGFDEEVAVAPVCARRNATAFRADHFRNLAYFLSPLCPVHADVAKRFGISPETMPSQTKTPATKLRPSIYWDLPGAALTDINSLPFVALQKSSESQESVSCRTTPDPQLTLVFDADVHCFGVADMADGQHDQSRLAVWRNDANQRLTLHNGMPYAIDLAHARSFRLWLNATDYVVPIEVRKGHQAGFEITCQPSVGLHREQEKVIPGYMLRWQGAAEGTFEVQNRQGNRSAASREIEFHYADLIGAAGVATDLSLVSLASEDGAQIHPTGIDLEFRSHLSLLVLQPQFMATEFEQVVETLGGHSWSIENADFSRVASLSLAKTLSQFLPGLLTFGLPLAFRRPELGGLVIWILQPETGAWTAAGGLAELLRQTEDRKRFFQEWIRLLRVVESSELSTDDLRNDAGLDYHTTVESQAADILADLGMAKP